MQSSVNTFNDYFDYVKGSDSAQDNVDPTDAVLVYNNVNPRCALALAVGMLGAAFLLGIYAILVAGWIPLAIAAVGAAIVVLYSGGKTPISYLPIGEAVSGIVMGGLIPLACYHVLTLQFEPLVLIWSVPVIIGIGLIMLTNNTCDVEKTSKRIDRRYRSKSAERGLASSIMRWSSRGSSQSRLSSPSGSRTASSSCRSCCSPPTLSSKRCSPTPSRRRRVSQP